MYHYLAQIVDYTNKCDFDLYVLKNFNRNILEGENIIVVNCAGYIGKPNVDACELAKADCVEGNVLFPAMLSQLCADRGLSICSHIFGMHLWWIRKTFHRRRCS